MSTEPENKPSIETLTQERDNWRSIAERFEENFKKALKRLDELEERRSECEVLRKSMQQAHLRVDEMRRERDVRMEQVEALLNALVRAEKEASK